ncbi:uncharacterized protein RHOBADRAFT_54046 [Rhodotorula graminis WP1]|uniref:Serine/threonine-protein phosphatase 2A activator n=1 Tax=Rhodotorula graminis (strain WP1) TaxID=578459 RepID=A0A194S0E0_RHOGW|nr:uncharacterized protein RHOBADRAFT_54046 [Rhodotorula graminis WP1]KPV74193.1 hypothetical protein RHOBADRAFT_54046 [Rhodotorula graminis WP1]
MLTAPDLPTLDPLPSAAVDPPVRKIYAQPDLEHWLRSDAYDSIDRFIQRLRVASTHPVSEPLSKAVQHVVHLLGEAASWIQEPDASATPTSSRTAFVAWLDRLEHAAADLHRTLVVDPNHAIALPELRAHLVAAFGSPQRLDYGTGHELSFLAYLLVLRRVGLVSAADEPALTRRVFADYKTLIRKVQGGFKLEPAGKLGVWGLDEHGHLVYHFGASQARIHPSKRPASLLSPPNASPNRIAYLFLTTLLHLHDDPSRPASTSTDDEDAGLLRLYRAEVLDRLPVVQHLRFGAVLRWIDASNGAKLPSTGDGLDPAAQLALDDVLDQRVRDSGTVAPWALPALSGEVPAGEMLERLPSPPGSATGTSSPSRSPGRRASPALGPPPPPPVSYPQGGLLGSRRASRLSISASFDDEGEDEGREEARQGERERGEEA